MSKALVSVIMPAYNAQKYIAESIESVIAQTYPNWELIVVDDGSTDGTAAIIKQYQLADTRVKYIFQKNSGQGNAKNRGIKHSTGAYIAFLDADDLWLKEKLAISVMALEEASADLLFTNYSVFDGQLATSDLVTMQVGDALYKGRESIILFLNYNQVPNLTVLATRRAMITAGEFKPIKVAEDYEMWLRMLGTGNTFKSISAPLSLYRKHHESITAKDRHATLEVIEIIKDFGRTHHAYAAEAKKIAADKIKHWLYNGYNANAEKFRLLSKGVFPATLLGLFFCLSYLLPIRHLRKLVIRLC